MDFKLLFRLFAIVGLSCGQVAPPAPTASCSFSVSGTEYICFLTIVNSEGLEIPTITGQHVEGRSDADVTYVIRNSGTTANIPSIFCSQFPNLIYLDLTNSGIQTAAEDSIAGCTNLQSFRIWSNRVTELSENFFNNNINLTYIDIDNNQLTTLPENIFASLVNLQTLEIRNNPYESIPSRIFQSQANLINLIMDNVRISEVNPEWFVPLTNLLSLTIGRNLFTTILTGTFNNLPALRSLSFGGNALLQNIPSNAFEQLTSLTYLDIGSNNIVEFNPEWVAPMTSTLQSLSLSFNQIEDPPEGAFASIENLSFLSLWGNQIKTLNRHYFGNLSNFYFLDLDENVINAMERSFFEETANTLQVLYFWNNICASGYFFDLNRNWEQGMQRLQRCFRNFEFSVETTTQGDDNYQFYSYPNPGIVLRVVAPERVHISLNPVNFEAVPRIEILIGENNNTRSIIRINGVDDVVNVATPNILDSNSWTGFRIIFSNWMVLVFREQDQFPFMGFNMQEFYPINFYGIRTPGNIVPWSIQPFNVDQITSTKINEYVPKKTIGYEKSMIHFYP